MAQAHISDFKEAKRILVLGVTGAGKSTAVHRIASLKNADVIDFDEIRWEPGSEKSWTPRPDDVQQALTNKVTDAERWVMAAVGGSTEEIVLPKVDLIVYLDYSPAIAFARLIKRTARRVVLKEKCCNGNTESLPNLVGKDAIILWWFKTFRDRHQKALATEANPDLPKTLRLTHPSQLDLLLS